MQNANTPGTNAVDPAQRADATIAVTGRQLIDSCPAIRLFGSVSCKGRRGSRTTSMPRCPITCWMPSKGTDAAVARYAHLLWIVTNDPRLSARARRLISAADVRFVSSASLWEAAIKAGLGSSISTSAS